MKLGKNLLKSTFLFVLFSSSLCLQCAELTGPKEAADTKTAAKKPVQKQVKKTTQKKASVPSKKHSSKLNDDQKPKEGISWGKIALSGAAIGVVGASAVIALIRSQRRQQPTEYPRTPSQFPGAGRTTGRTNYDQQIPTYPSFRMPVLTTTIPEPATELNFTPSDVFDPRADYAQRASFGPFSEGLASTEEESAIQIALRFSQIHFDYNQQDADRMARCMLTQSQEPIKAKSITYMRASGQSSSWDLIGTLGKFIDYNAKDPYGVLSDFYNIVETMLKILNEDESSPKKFSMQKALFIGNQLEAIFTQAEISRQISFIGFGVPDSLVSGYSVDSGLTPKERKLIACYAFWIAVYSGLITLNTEQTDHFWSIKALKNNNNFIFFTLLFNIFGQADRNRAENFIYEILNKAQEFGPNVTLDILGGLYQSSTNYFANLAEDSRLNIPTKNQIADVLKRIKSKGQQR